MDFDVVISGDTRLVARFARWPTDLHDALLVRIRDLTSRMEDRVRALAPSRTGKLKSEIVSTVYDQPKRIRGVVTLGPGLPGYEYAKAGALEYGAPGRGGRFKVKDYRRVITKVFGRAVAPVTVTVAAHTRMARLDPRMYLHGGLEGMQVDAAAELRDVINQQAGALVE